MNSIFLEAESFHNCGGWVVDTVPMHRMGSACLMAHGAGVPVADAETGIDIDCPGEYHLFARTRDWTAVWGRGTPAGRFTLRIDGIDLPTELGTNGEEWAWQKAGSIRLTRGKHRLALHDLTGFNARCDAIYLTTDPEEIPPDGDAELDAFRRKHTPIKTTDDPVIYDLVVASRAEALLGP